MLAIAALAKTGSALGSCQRQRCGKISAWKLKEKVRGTGITYEDLTSSFCIGKTRALLGDETIRTRVAGNWQVVTADRSSQYWNVVIWVDKASAR